MDLLLAVLFWVTCLISVNMGSFKLRSAKSFLIWFVFWSWCSCFGFLAWLRSIMNRTKGSSVFVYGSPLLEAWDDFEIDFSCLNNVLKDNRNFVDHAVSNSVLSLEQSVKIWCSLLLSPTAACNSWCNLSCALTVCMQFFIKRSKDWQRAFSKSEGDSLENSRLPSVVLSSKMLVDYLSCFSLSAMDICKRFVDD